MWKYSQLCGINTELHYKGIIIKLTLHNIFNFRQEIKMDNQTDAGCTFRQTVNR